MSRPHDIGLIATGAIAGTKASLVPIPPFKRTRDAGFSRLASRQFDHLAVADGDAAVHLRCDVEVVRGDDGGKAGLANQLR
jgi:hypothetical protein